MSKLSAFDSLFPHDDNKERDPPNARQHAGILWQELDHLGFVNFPKILHNLSDHYIPKNKI